MTFMRAIGVAAVGALMHCAAIASAVVPLNTFPDSGVPDGPDAGLFAAAMDGQEIAVPFSVPTAGRITSIQTGIQLGSGLCGWRLGVMPSGTLYGSTGQWGFDSYADGTLATQPWAYSVALTSYISPDPISNCEAGTVVPTGTFVSLTGLDWFLESGDYVLVAAWRSDIENASWLTNASLLSDQWAIQVIGSSPYSATSYPCGGSGAEAPWVALSECGIDPRPTPAARINFAPGLRVPEPGVFVLFSVGVALLLVSQRASAVRARRSAAQTGASDRGAMGELDG